MEETGQARDGEVGLKAEHGQTLATNAGIRRHLFSSARLVQQTFVLTFLLIMVGASGHTAAAQNALPFEVSNPKNKKWPTDEALRIYSSACSLVARTVRPERPPHLHPTFRLVLGTADDEVVRGNSMAEIHLKSWNSEKFAEAAVILAAREVLQGDDLIKIVRQTVSLANATVSLNDLRESQ